MPVPPPATHFRQPSSPHSPPCSGPHTATEHVPADWLLGPLLTINISRAVRVTSWRRPRLVKSTYSVVLAPMNNLLRDYAKHSLLVMCNWNACLQMAKIKNSTGKAAKLAKIQSRMSVIIWTHRQDHRPVSTNYSPGRTCSTAPSCGHTEAVDNVLQSRQLSCACR